MTERGEAERALGSSKDFSFPIYPRNERDIYTDIDA